jgi:hypothetical protein
MVTQLVKKKLSPFMEHKGSLLCSEQPVTERYPEPDESNTHPISSRSILILANQVINYLHRGMSLKSR